MLFILYKDIIIFCRKIIIYKNALLINMINHFNIKCRKSGKIRNSMIFYFIQKDKL